MVLNANANFVYDKSKDNQKQTQPILPASGQIFFTLANFVFSTSVKFLTLLNSSKRFSIYDSNINRF